MQHVGRYEGLYGSFGSVLGLMLWAWVSSLAVLTGAVVNAELERQAARHGAEAAAEER